MSIERLRRQHPEAAASLERQAQRLRFSAGLTDSLATTLLRSIVGGDGKLWTDSHLIASLIDDRGSLRTLFDGAFEHRTRLIGEDFKSTLARQKLTIDPTFQSTVQELLFRRAWNDKTELTEAGLLLFEVQEARGWFEDEYSALAGLVADVSRSWFDRADTEPDPAISSALRRFAQLLEDTIYVSMMCGVHPFETFLPQQDLDETGRMDGLSPTPESAAFRRIARRFTKRSFARARTRFYWRLLDTAGAGQRLTDEEVGQLSSAFSYDHFEAACGQMDEVLDRQESSASDNKTKVRTTLRSSCFFAGDLLLKNDISLDFLANKLQKWRPDAETSWPRSSRLLVSLGPDLIQVERMDVSGTLASTGPRDRTKARLSKAGLWAPSPIWTPSVLDRFEYLINRSDIREHELQTFFELYPQFILNDLQVEAFPQVVLFREVGGDLRPDFAIAGESNFVDLVELKLPTAPIVHGSGSRPVLSRHVASAIAQLKEYREWFRDGSNRQWFRERYGLEGFEPRLTLIIGRRHHIVNEEVRRRALADDHVNLLTYDDLADAVRRRRRWLAE